LKALVQRVRSACVTVGDDVIGEISTGLCVLIGVAASDTEDGAARLARRVANLRVFENDDGRFDRSLLEVGGAALVVSQFTLIADTRKGNRPSFADAAAPEHALALFGVFCDRLRLEGVAQVKTGRFGSRMLVEIANDGPVTVLLEA
jgi:D-tyrosyl-tRNA(Tyr) deacylase